MVICLPEGWGTFDADLQEKSLKSMEVLVNVGEKIGLFAASTSKSKGLPELGAKAI